MEVKDIMITKLTNKEKMIANIIFILEHKTSKEQKKKLKDRGYIIQYFEGEERYESYAKYRINMNIFNGKGNKELNELYMDIIREFGNDWLEYDNSTEDITVDDNGVAWVNEKG